MTPQLAPRVGLLGGAFDPPHRAHLALAQAALDALALDVLHVVPTGHAWHKPRALSAAAHRLAMTQLAFADWPRVCVDACEIERDGPSYTVDTLRALRTRYGVGVALHLVLGLDQARAIASWHQSGQIPRLAILCVAFRADLSGGNGAFDALDWPPDRLIRLPFDPQPFSSTALRATLAEGLDPGNALVPAVSRYIADHHLYRTTA